jgi:hypothetical protein
VKRAIALITGILLLLSHAVLNAHSGGLDAHGGHNDRKAGNYHFHRGPLAGQTYASKADALRALSGVQGSTPSKSAPQTERTPAKSRALALPGSTQDLTRTVYIAQTGERYHGPSCSALRRSKIAVTLREALAKGLTECAICKGH